MLVYNCRRVMIIISIMEAAKIVFIYIAVAQILNHQVLSQQQPAQYLLNYGAPSLPANGLQTSKPSPLLLPPTSAPVGQNKPGLKLPEATNGPLDSNVLNNLAIALQLLIVSNIMNMPPTEPSQIPNLAKLESLLSKYESSIPRSKLPISYLEQALTKPNLYSLEALAKPSLYSYETQSVPKSSLYSYETQSVPKQTLYSYEAQSVPKQTLYSYEAQSVPKSTLYSYDTQSVPKQTLYSYEAQSLPNANFLGSSGLVDPVLGSISKARTNPRSSVTLMSPYDALGTSSFVDPLSSFPTSYSKKDFQSPYASILAADGARDMFSISDLF